MLLILVLVGTVEATADMVVLGTSADVVADMAMY